MCTLHGVGWVGKRARERVQGNHIRLPCNQIMGDGSDPNPVTELLVQWCSIFQAADLTVLSQYGICYISKL